MKAARVLATLSALSLTTAGAATYTVKAGDTLFKIATANGLETATLMRLNGLRSTTIEVGQRLNLGAGSTFAKAAPAQAARPAAKTAGGAYVNTAATRYLGIRYALGGTGAGGIDCSGYTMRVFQQLGVRLPRTAAGQWGMGYAVSSRNLQAGDLVFFNTTGRGVSHVGVYLGNGMMANANSYYGRTVVEPLFGNPYWASRYLGARRVIG
ncbi:Cell wall-associated hydrolase, NlpC family [Deinococcus reticulitermitis]|uniref:Cell wall-associated hydrolase, NlpC family n=1 Tax=Deinococcus reticulitermitis TaxID=856736 RepID=A0A1H6TAI9_9DEIO|nr:LysM peptidoglycan-binding domain-containing C40 family peptidase [Deinococcus reticulitermitis]SEI73255.1 Cell wall-associated hydrolase, NlpC family [Deinococcus reticulitermitis]